jgi:catechol 2,3-dioxygenase-like lactoylglutathione lyase family enzyme
MSKVSEVRYVGYAVPDLEAERQFYKDKWLLRQVADQDAMVYFAAEGSDQPYVVRLRQAAVKRVEVIGLAAETAAAVDDLHTKTKDAGCRIIFAPRQLDGFGGGYGFRFFSPDGLPFEISSDVAGGSARALKRGEAVPEKVSHIVLHSPRHKETTEFFIDVLGFKLTDWIGDFMSFLRCNEWHHRIAILPGPPCLNHVAYDMPTVDDMMRGIARLKRNSVDLLWGPGRHTAGNNTFSYFATPNGFAVEYTSVLERVDDSWTPSIHAPRPEIMDQWGIATGGPQTMPHPEADSGLFQPSDR